MKILLINLKEEREWVTSFINRNKYSSTVLFDTDGKIAKNYSVYGIPVSYLIDKKGNVAFQAPGELDWSSSKMSSFLSSVINE